MISSNSYVSMFLRISNCSFFVLALTGVFRGAVNLEGIESARVLNRRVSPSFRSVFLEVAGGVAGSYDDEDVEDGGERGESERRRWWAHCSGAGNDRKWGLLFSSAHGTISLNFRVLFLCTSSRRVSPCRIRGRG
jgi:hypothetical protein